MKRGQSPTPIRPPVDSNASDWQLPAINQLPATEAGETDGIGVEEKPLPVTRQLKLRTPSTTQLSIMTSSRSLYGWRWRQNCKAGHLVQVYAGWLSPRRARSPETDQLLTGLQRGSHSLSARVMNAQGPGWPIFPCNYPCQRHSSATKSSEGEITPDK